jgi:uncharacterized membrane protein YccC
VLAAGTAVGDPVAAVTMAAGAMLVGVAWRVGGGRPPLATMATTTVVMGISTFAGAASGQVPWLHFALVAVWALLAGLIVALGPRGAAVGLQAIIAIVVFGRFPQPIPAAAGLAGLVIAGGVTQLLFCTLVGLSPGLRPQRAALAAAYRRLAAVAASGGSTAPVAASLDQAQATLNSPTLLGDRSILALSSLVVEGRRIRLQLAGLELLIDQYVRPLDPAEIALPRSAARLRETTATVLRAIADELESDDDGPAIDLGALAGQLNGSLDGVTAAAEHDGAVLAHHVAQHAAALAGQVRAAVGLAAEVRDRHGLVPVRPTLRTSRQYQSLRWGFDQVRANASLESAAGRHAVRLAVVVAGTEVLAEHIPIQRNYWMVVAAAAVLKPDFGGTLTRGSERVLGTCAGVVLAGLLIVGLHPSGWATVGLVGLLAWAAYAIFPASFAAATVFLTGMIVFLLNVVTADTLATALARGLNTIIGGAIGLLAYAVWPTWSRVPARQALAQLVSAQRSYLGSLLDPLVDGAALPEDEVASAARQARIAWTNAEATVSRSLAEPVTRRIDAEQSRGLLSGLRRLVLAAHIVRLECQRRTRHAPLPTLRPFVSALDESLKTITHALAADGVHATALPPLRALHQALLRETKGEPRDPLLVAQLDEIADATNTVGELLGLGPGPMPANL